MSQPKLILVKHSLPIIDPELPASLWELSPEGRKRCLPVAQKVAIYQPQRIFSSHEPKAVQTAGILAEELGLQSHVGADLHEHKRLKPGLLSPQDFEEKVKALFSNPDNIVFGDESAAQAQARFHKAVTNLIAHHPEKNILVVTHGTVISLFLQLVCQVDPFPLWKSLKLPSFVVLSLPDYRLEQIIPSITPNNAILTEGK